MAERDTDDRERGERILSCPGCGASHRADDRFCAQCGASLPALSPEIEPGLTPETAPGSAFPPETDGAAPGLALPESPKNDAPDQDNAAWVLGARPTTVIGGGIVLLLLAAALLAIGQRDRTGTIVMLSICTAPLGLLTLAIGIARAVASLRGERG